MEANVPSLQNQRAGLSWRPPPQPATLYPGFNEGRGRGGEQEAAGAAAQSSAWAHEEQGKERVKGAR